MLYRKFVGDIVRAKDTDKYVYLLIKLSKIKFVGVMLGAKITDK